MKAAFTLLYISPYLAVPEVILIIVGEGLHKNQALSIFNFHTQRL